MDPIIIDRENPTFDMTHVSLSSACYETRYLISLSFSLSLSPSLSLSLSLSLSPSLFLSLSLSHSNTRTIRRRAWARLGQVRSPNSGCIATPKEEGGILINNNGNPKGRVIIRIY